MPPYLVVEVPSRYNKLHFYNIRGSGLYFVGVSDRDVPPYLVVEILSRYNKLHFCNIRRSGLYFVGGI